MAIYELSESPRFPPVSHAEPDGLLAVGGDLTAQRLDAAYRAGIFPWFEDDTQLLWWAPDPRCLLFPQKLKISQSLKRVLKNDTFSVTADTQFTRVMRACRDMVRAGQDGTWITDGMITAYTELHQQGLAHSVEVWQQERLVGGLYGVSQGQAFFGESMFSMQKNASKVAFAHLAKCLQTHNFSFIDCQLPTPHLESLGASPVPREHFMTLLDDALSADTHAHVWTPWFNQCPPSFT